MVGGDAARTSDAAHAGCSGSLSGTFDEKHDETHPHEPEWSNEEMKWTLT